MAIITEPKNTSPDIVVHGAEATAPVAATVLADTLPIGVTGGISARVAVVASIGGDDTVLTIELAHRNAANNADVEVRYAGVPAAGPYEVEGYFVLAAGERVVARNKVAGTAAKVYQASVYVWFLP